MILNFHFAQTAPQPPHPRPEVQINWQNRLSTELHTVGQSNEHKAAPTGTDETLEWSTENTFRPQLGGEEKRPMGKFDHGTIWIYRSNDSLGGSESNLTSQPGQKKRMWPDNGITRVSICILLIEAPFRPLCSLSSSLSFSPTGSQLYFWRTCRKLHYRKVANCKCKLLQDGFPHS